jgi:hypothetical protein
LQIIEVADPGHGLTYMRRRTRGQESADRGDRLSPEKGHHSAGMTPIPKEKFYCYVDETGQDPASSVFVVVVVVSAEDQEALRQTLMNIEDAAGTGRRKWHKSRSERRLRYLRMVLESNLVCADVFYGVYQKPIPYFFPMPEVLEGAIKSKGKLNTTARVFRRWH